MRFEGDAGVTNVGLSLGTFFPTCGPSITRLDLHVVPEVEFPVQELRRVIFELTPGLKEFILRPEVHVPTWNTSAGQSSTEASVANVKELPRLKRLKFIGSERVNYAYRQLILEIIINAPGLEALSLLSDAERVYGYNENNFLVPLLSGLSAPLVSKLKTFKLSELRIPELQLLVQLDRRGRLRLDTFGATVTCRHENIGSLEERSQTANLLHIFLVSQSPTLQKLSLKFSEGDSLHQELHGFVGYRQNTFGLPILIPNMVRLQKFKLERSENSEVRFQFEGGCEAAESGTRLTRVFPNLARLVYVYPVGHRFYKNPLVDNFHDDMGQLAHSRVTNLSVTAAAEDLARFPALFPRVTSLEANITQVRSMQEVRGIWNLWPQLRRLFLRFDCCRSELQHADGSRQDHEVLIVDELLTGIKPQNSSEGRPTYDWLLCKLEAPGVDLERLQELGTEFKDGPGLADLPQLEEFELKMASYFPGLTDVSDYFAFALALERPHHRLRPIVIHGERVHYKNPKTCTEYCRLPSLGSPISESCSRFIRSSAFGPRAAVIDLGPCCASNPVHQRVPFRVQLVTLIGLLK